MTRTVKRTNQLAAGAQKKKTRISSSQTMERLKNGTIIEENSGPHVEVLAAKSFVTIFRNELLDWAAKLSKRKEMKKAKKKTKKSAK